MTESEVDTFSELVEQLLYEEEGPALDFKRDQYPFVGASNGQKAELLKDILAMANAWRRVEGFILIGVDEVRGGRSRPVGVGDHLDDASLQQFVTAKTNRPVEFSYREVTVDGVELGVIGIPVQERPLYLTRDYGGLEAEVVYLRRGSSTGQAKPDEIAKMGKSVGGGAQHAPELEFGAGVFGNRNAVGQSVEFSVLDLEPFRARDYPSGSGHNYVPVTNTDYLRELVDFVRVKEITGPVGLVVHNPNGPHAMQVEWRAQVPKEDHLWVLSPSTMPERPHPMLLRQSVGEQVRSIFSPPPITVNAFEDHWEVRVRFGDILPGDSSWASSPLFIGSSKDCCVTIEGKLFAANLMAPETAGFEVSFSVRCRPMGEADLRPYLEEDEALR